MQLAKASLVNKTRISKKLIFAAITLIIGLGIFLAARKIYSESEMKTATFNPAVTASAKELENAFVSVAKHVRPVVVSVYSEKVVKFKSHDFLLPYGDDTFSQFFGEHPIDQDSQRGKQREHSVPVKGMGSGMVLDNNGHILTNYHVVGNVDRIKVQLDNRRTYRARVTQADPKTDIAVIQMLGDFPRDLPLISFGDSDSLKVGDLVIAVGAPFGLSQTVTQGIVSATGRSNVGIEVYEDFIQTDAAINPGNSGGPLVNMNGEIIGINTAIAASGTGQFSGVGFAVPSNLIKAMLPKLIKGEKILRGRLGVVIQDLSDDLALQFDLQENSGVLVSEVETDSPANRAGLKPGDVIIRFNEISIGDSSQLRNLVSNSAPGTGINLKIIRNKNEISLIAKVGAENEEPVSTENLSEKKEGFLDRIGLSVENIDKAFVDNFNMDSGAVVTKIHEASPAAFAGLLPTDVIIEANHKKVQNVKDLKNILDKSKNQDSVLLLVKRQNIGLYFAIQTRD